MKKNSFLHLFHTCHPTIERKMVLGTLLGCHALDDLTLNDPVINFLKKLNKRIKIEE